MSPHTILVTYMKHATPVSENSNSQGKPVGYWKVPEGYIPNRSDIEYRAPAPTEGFYFSYFAHN